MFVMDFDTLQSESPLKVGRKVFYNLKGKIRKLLKKVKEGKIGKKNGTVVIDETYICRGKIIKCPTNTNDETPGLQWIVGGADKENPHVIFMELIPNRTVETFCNTFKRNINEGNNLLI